MQRRKPMTRRHQERRRRALERFSINEKLAQTQPKYLERKQAERASLQQSLGS